MAAHFWENLVSDVLLGIRLYLGILFVIFAPWIGPLMARWGYFHHYELISLLLIPPLYVFVVGLVDILRVAPLLKHLDSGYHGYLFGNPCQIYPFFKNPHRLTLGDALVAHRNAHTISSILAGIYQFFIILVLSPGGPPDMKGAFWSWTIGLYVPSVILVVGSELYLRIAYLKESHPC